MNIPTDLQINFEGGAIGGGRVVVLTGIDARSCGGCGGGGGGGGSGQADSSGGGQRWRR